MTYTVQRRTPGAARWSTVWQTADREVAVVELRYLARLGDGAELRIVEAS